MAKKDATKAGMEEQTDAPNAGAQKADAPVVASPMAVPVGGWPVDEFSGQPGTFLRDPFTGVRSRAPEEGK